MLVPAGEPLKFNMPPKPAEPEMVSGLSIARLMRPLVAIAKEAIETGLCVTSSVPPETRTGPATQRLAPTGSRQHPAGDVGATRVDVDRLQRERAGIDFRVNCPTRESN